MQDELKNVISQAMNNSSEFQPEHIAVGSEELSEEDLEAVAGGICIYFTIPIVCLRNTKFRNANKLA
ncbi:hypothetical protein SAMD00079811_02700 [Scytonema sp. HK-05]|uniref:hypothetical protein n=1 Tax=Scytonema sp. HK-05 TaxID=1137095 RepID=UPI0009371AC9|nr:hypothetical protein [Scytonema sp. HK-05]OKH60005.1 hypothetical protein NIES2130_05995 [Scytonema sp. HK-05]BAY42692.1 hypothetical protein SAMD00079811_02700 [Scytonema sp. HK-05]